MAIWSIFSRSGMLHRENIWQPCLARSPEKLASSPFCCFSARDSFFYFIIWCPVSKSLEDERNSSRLDREQSDLMEFVNISPKLWPEPFFSQL
jgi:hypothetical protein